MPGNVWWPTLRQVRQLGGVTARCPEMWSSEGKRWNSPAPREDQTVLLMSNLVCIILVILKVGLSKTFHCEYCFTKNAVSLVSCVWGVGVGGELANPTKYIYIAYSYPNKQSDWISCKIT